MSKYLKESKDLYKGIFWITDLEKIENNDLYFQIPCDSNGEITTLEFVSNAKSGTTYNHENTWKQLSKKETQGKPFNYFPRGRVQIANGKATVFLSPHILTDEIKHWIIDKFNLTSLNGIKQVKFVADGSNHYKCYLDNE